MDLTPQQKLELITSNLEEVFHRKLIEDVVLTEQRPLKIYWGTAITGRPHCAYFVPMLKIAQFLRAGANVKILLADLHGFLDADKTSEELLESRTEYYRFVVENMLKAIGVSLDKLEFVKGRTYQLTPNYCFDLLRLTTMTSEHDAKKAGSEVVKQMDSSPLSGSIYPLMQALDEEYLGVDAQFGGLDQRKIFTFAKDSLPKLKYKERAHLMNPMVPGLTGGKMSSSEPESKIDVLDTPEVVTKKIKKAFAEPKKVENNGLLAFAEYVLFPASELREGKPRLVVERIREEKEPLVYGSVEEMRRDYQDDVLTPQLLKTCVTRSLNDLLSPIQMAYNQSLEAQEMTRKAYPEAGKEKPAKDKKKDKGAKKKGAGRQEGEQHANGASTPTTNGEPLPVR
ncbi:MAG: hypothetical protein Q9162_004510 [Coniocarpon cinnabarinum]